MSDTPPTMTPEQAYVLLYGAAPSPETLALMRTRSLMEPVASLAGLRRLLMGLEREHHVTPAVIRFGSRDLVRVPLNGFTMVLDSGDVAISAHIVASRIWEPALTGVFRRYLRPGHRVADIGANVGYYSMLARSLVGETGHVFAFDPNSENARSLLLSIAANGFRNVTLHPLALSDRTGHAVFSSKLGSNGQMSGTAEEDLADPRSVVVPTMRLDDLVKGPLDFIKMDTEGAEYRIARGAGRILASCRPIVSTEFSCDMLARASGAHPRDYLALYLSLGYAIHQLDMDTGRLHPIPDIDAYLAAWTDPARIDDLLMLPAGIPSLQP